METLDNIDPTITALTTLALLHNRLARLEHIILGHSNRSYTADGTTVPSPSPRTVPAQLLDLEARLNKLRRLDGVPGSMVRMIENLRREHPEIFQQRSSSPVAIHGSTATDIENTRDGTAIDAAANTTTTTSPRSSTLRLAKQAAEILAHQMVYTSTSAQLQTLQTLQIPPAANSAVLIEQEPRLAPLHQKQDRLKSEIDALRERSARILEWWVRVGVVGMGEVVEDWETRVVECDRVMKRLQQRRHEEYS